MFIKLVRIIFEIGSVYTTYTHTFSLYIQCKTTEEIMDSYIHIYIHTYLISMQHSEIGHSNRKLAIRSNPKSELMYVCMYIYMQVNVFLCEPVSEEETVSGTVHGLHRKFLILDFEDKHILPQERKKEHVSVYGCIYI